MPADEPDLVLDKQVRSIIHSLPLEKAADPAWPSYKWTSEIWRFRASSYPIILL